MNTLPFNFFNWFAKTCLVLLCVLLLNGLFWPLLMASQADEPISTALSTRSLIEADGFDYICPGVEKMEIVG